jgi:ribose/xylose/arabinose/galactoside ABC-type transport system permease subunit
VAHLGQARADAATGYELNAITAVVLGGASVSGGRGTIWGSLLGLVVLSVLLIWVAMGYFDERRSAALKIGSLYWHFVDVVWIFIFTTLYVTPFLF